MGKKKKFRAVIEAAGKGGAFVTIFFKQLAYTRPKEHVQWIEEAKRE